MTRAVRRVLKHYLPPESPLHARTVMLQHLTRRCNPHPSWAQAIVDITCRMKIAPEDLTPRMHRRCQVWLRTFSEAHPVSVQSLGYNHCPSVSPRCPICINQIIETTDAMLVISTRNGSREYTLDILSHTSQPNVLPPLPPSSLPSPYSLPEPN